MSDLRPLCLHTVFPKSIGFTFLNVILDSLWTLVTGRDRCIDGVLVVRSDCEDEQVAEKYRD